MSRLTFHVTNGARLADSLRENPRAVTIRRELSLDQPGEGGRWGPHRIAIEYHVVTGVDDDGRPVGADGPLDIGLGRHDYPCWAEGDIHA